MIQGSTAASILAESRLVLKTKGEWELSDIRVTSSTLDIVDGAYSEVIFFVSTLSFF